MALISIIMPVYNSDKFLSEAIDSILNQSFKDFELILVDDGSTDNSGEICDKYSLLDSRVKVMHQKNGGISDARNKGIQMASGKYIVFADNDDIFLENLLEHNIYLAQKYNADIVKFGVEYFLVNGDKKKKINIRNIDSTVLNKYDIQKQYIQLKNNNLFVYVWDALFKADLIKSKEIYFNTNFKLGGEDINFNLSVYPYIKKMVINKEKYYIHYKRISHSTAAKFSEMKLIAYIINAELEFNLLQNNNTVQNKERVWLECMSVHLWQIIYALTKIENMPAPNKILYIKELKNISCFRVTYTVGQIMDVFKYNKKRAIILLLYRSKQYGFLYRIAKTIK